jgi:hypothetical protein
MYCKCGEVILQIRINLGYKTCVKCSNESKWAVVPVNYHKTGNTAEVIKDPKVAADFLFMSSRKGFGVMRGMTMSRRQETSVRTHRERKEARPPIRYFFEEVGKEALQVAESSSVEEARSYVKKALREKRINRSHAERINNIVEILAASK